MDPKTQILWADLETPGLEEREPWSAILEAAFVGTDLQGNITGAVVVVPEYPSNFLDFVWENMDQYCKDMHTKSGLWDEVRSKQGPEVWSLEDDTQAIPMSEWAPAVAALPTFRAFQKVTEGIQRMLDIDPFEHKLPMGGASVHFDRRWLRQHWPQIEEGFHYRHVDISSLRVFTKAALGDAVDSEPEKRFCHRAYADVEDEIDYYKWALEQFSKGGGNGRAN